MKIVINSSFGGFSLPIEFCELLNKYNENGKPDIYDWEDEIERTDERLINFLENNEKYSVPSYTSLEVVEIPDNATDWEINEYDGAENIIYVVDGKIHWA